MIAKIISADRGKVVLDEVIYTIPEFKELWEETKEIGYIQFLWALYDPESPYQNLPNHEVEDRVKEDISNAHPEVDFFNEYFLVAREKAESLYYSPIRRLLDGAKAAVENIADFMKNTTITDGRDGNIAQIRGTIKELASMIKNYEATEESYKKEMSKTRGSSILGIDEVDNNDEDY